MDSASSVDTYRSHLSEYRRFLASRQYEQALQSLDAAITCCPVDEALPTLSAYRDALEPKVSRQWWQVWRVAA